MNWAGSTRLSGGYVVFCETELQPGSKAELLADLAESHHHDSDETLSLAYVENAPSTYRRMKELGLQFFRVETFAHMSKPWAHELPKGDLGGGAQIAAALAAAAAKRNVELCVSTQASRLSRDSNGRVDGVYVRSGSGSKLIRARRGVVIASGGFTRNLDLIKCFGRPGAERIVPLTGPGSRGDGLVMGMDIGAGLSYIGIGVAPTAPADPITRKPCLVIYAGGIMLNKEGNRFVDESIVYLDISWAGLAQTNGMMLQVYDSRIREAYLTSMLGQVVFGGTEYVADTLEELFQKVADTEGFDVANGLASVRRYNEHVTGGKDIDFGREHPLGRGGIGSDSGELLRLEKPPFYAASTVAGTTHFNGGLRVDDTMSVVDVFGRKIPGLFAAGEVMGGFHGAGYMSASFIGGALIFGRIAGKSAAAGDGPNARLQ